jgi:glycosyltransferase involved in cell wall biosynthesis
MKRNPHILIISQYFYPENFQINTLAIELIKKGYKVSVLTGLPNYPSGKIFQKYSLINGPYKEQWSEIEVYRVPIIPRGDGSALKLLINYLSFALSSVFFSFFYFKKAQFDHQIVFQTSPITVALPAIFLKSIKKTPIHLWIQDLWPESIEAVGMIKNKYLIKIIEKFVKWIYRHCDQLFIQSEKFRQSLLDKNVNNEIIYFLPNWAPDFYIKNYSIHSQSKVKIISYAGNIGKAQNLEKLIDVSKVIDSHRLIWKIIGEGSELNYLKSLVKRNKLSHSFQFIDSVPADQVFDFVKDSTALLVSLKSHATFSQVIPSKVQTYMAMRKPILASIDGEARKLIEKARCGLVSSPEDLDSFIENINKIISMSDSDLELMAKNGQNYFLKHFKKDIVINQLEQSMVNFRQRKAS